MNIKQLNEELEKILKNVFKIEESYSETKPYTTYLAYRNDNKMYQYRSLDKAKNKAQEIKGDLYLVEPNIAGTSKSWKLMDSYRIKSTPKWSQFKVVQDELDRLNNGRYVLSFRSDNTLSVMKDDKELFNSDSAEDIMKWLKNN